MMNGDLGMMSEEITQEPAPAGPQPVGIRVAIQGRQVVVLVGGAGIALLPEQALELAGTIRGYANRVLHAEHEEQARERRAARERRRA